MMHRLFPFILLLSACSTGPQGADSLEISGEYPRLVPLSPVLVRAEDGSRVVAETQALQARAALLKRKANALRGYGLDEGQARLKAVN